ncbi:MAG: peptidylprolyl isomerase [Xanthomonadales bacterium]|nr:peptidylprolyl isomerase [Xanthomonadales bacterium]
MKTPAWLAIAAFAGALLLTPPLMAQEGMTWREVPQSDLVFLELLLTDGRKGTVVVELNDRFAPRTAEQFRRLVKADFYRGLSFYRVIDGFVAQGGDGSDIDQPNDEPNLPAEFEIARDEEQPWTPVQNDDLFAPETGFVDGFAAARDTDHVWLTHCPGVIAMARNNEPDTGSTDFYIVIGQAPRYLDRNLTIFGRVIHGMDVVQQVRRGPVHENGIIESDTARTRISDAYLAEDRPTDQQKVYFVMDTNSEGFRDYMEARRHRKHEFFHHTPPPKLDVCQVPVATRIEKPASVAQAAD